MTNANVKVIKFRCFEDDKRYVVRQFVVDLKGSIKIDYELEGKTLVCLKPCDSYSFNQLLAEHRVDREKAYIIGVGCKGKLTIENVKRAGVKGILSVTDTDPLQVETLYGNTEVPYKAAMLDRCHVCKGKEHAPELWIEHAMEFEYVEFSDVFRTYDVENVIAQPLTIRRVSEMLAYKAQEGVKGIINCEDEPYIAAGLGCAIGIMRHPIDGPTPSGLKDNAFPPVGHNYKKCLDEIVRGVRWHRIAEPFGVNNDGQCDPTRLEDYWIYNDRDSWVGRDEGSIMREEAPAIVSRAMPLPEVKDTSSDRPYILASTYPNGALAVAAIGRALGREYVTKEIDVKVKGSEWDAPVGLFGYFKSVTIEYPSVAPEKARIWAQDLAGDTPVDITAEVKIDGNEIRIPGDVIKKVGLMNATEGDLSGPGLVMNVL